jgi:hypothetical protein
MFEFTYPTTWTFILFPVGIYVLAVLCLLHARKEGRSTVYWFVTAIILGYLMEFFQLKSPINEYVYGPFLIKIFGVGLWAGVGWAVFIYGVVQTAVKLNLPPLLAASFGGLISLTIGMSYEPISSICSTCTEPLANNGLGFFDWNRYGQWFGEPLDPFPGWFFLMAAFYLVLYYANKRWPPAQRDTKQELQAAGMILVGGFILTTLPILVYLVLDKIIPASIILIVWFGLNAILVFRQFPTFNRNHKPDLLLVAVPMYIHVFFGTAMFIVGLYKPQPSLIPLWLGMMVLSAALFWLPYSQR